MIEINLYVPLSQTDEWEIEKTYHIEAGKEIDLPIIYINETSVYLGRKDLSKTLYTSNQTFTNTMDLYLKNELRKL